MTIPSAEDDPLNTVAGLLIASNAWNEGRGAGLRIAYADSEGRPVPHKDNPYSLPLLKAMKARDKEIGE